MGGCRERERVTDHPYTVPLGWEWGGVVGPLPYTLRDTRLHWYVPDVPHTHTHTHTHTAYL